MSQCFSSINHQNVPCFAHLGFFRYIEWVLCCYMTPYDVMEEYSARSGNWCFERFLNPLLQNYVIEEYLGGSRVIVHKFILFTESRQQLGVYSQTVLCEENGSS